MKTRITNQAGFGATLVLLILLVITLLVGGAYYIYSNKSNSNNNTAIPGNDQSDQDDDVKLVNFPISEWGVQMQLDEKLQNPTYDIVMLGSSTKQVATLSTAAINNSAVCQENRGDSVYGYQYIERYSPNDEILLDEAGQEKALASEMAKESDRFKQLGNYVYRFVHGNAFPCEEGGNEAFAAYLAAFDTLAQLEL